MTYNKNTNHNQIIYIFCTALAIFFFSFSVYSEECTKKLHNNAEKYTCNTKITFFGSSTSDNSYNNTNNTKIEEVKDTNLSKNINKNAPKGGLITYAAIGGFDTLNPFTLKGIAAAGSSMIYDSLLTSDDDDIFSRRGLIADEIFLAHDKSSIIFALNDKALWHDGKKITPEDVKFSFDIITKEGNPFYASYYADVASVEVLPDNMVRFNFKTDKNRELPFIVGEMPILPKHFWSGKDFSATILEVPLGSSAYKIKSLEAGKTITYERVADYWAKEHPENIGKYNFDEIKYDYYRDETVVVEAFKAGEFDIRSENIAKNWNSAYDFEALKTGDVIKKEIPHSLPTGMQAFAFNLRKDKFSDIRVRQAIGLAFDFEWCNKTLFYESYTRTRSYFSNSIYEAKGLPTEQELEILQQLQTKYPADIEPETLSQEFNPPKTSGDGSNRSNLKAAFTLLKEAGWVAQDGILRNAAGEALELEFLINSKAFERVLEPYSNHLQRLGIQTKIKLVDPAKYVKQVEAYDYDIIVTTFGGGLIPGNELMNYYHSSTADISGAGNYIGIKNKAVDDIVTKIINAQTKEELTLYCKVLDRILQHKHYVVPNWNITKHRIIYWDKFSMPEQPPKYSLGIERWWLK